MSKKLLSEAQLRRFAKLANLPVINEMEYKRDEDLEEAYGGNKGDESRSKRDYMEEEAPYGGNKGDESRSKRDYMKEDADEEIAMDAAEAGMGDLPEPEEAELDDMAGDTADLGAREEMAMDVISAVADALNIEVDIEDTAGDEDVEVEDEIAMDDGDEIEMGAEEEVVDDEEMVMEALRGITYVPGKKEIVNEVAKRVARRLLKAKRAEQSLQEALGNKKPQSHPARTTRRRRTKK